MSMGKSQKSNIGCVFVIQSVFMDVSGLLKSAAF